MWERSEERLFGGGAWAVVCVSVIVAFGRCVESRISKSHLTSLCTINPWQSALRSAIRVFVTKNLRVCPSAHA